MDITNSRLLPSRNNTRATRHANALPLTGMIIGLLSISMLAVSAQGSELDCTNWESENFWKQATRREVDNCIGQGIDFGNSLYQAAGYNTSPDMIRALIAAGATVNARDPKGLTSLDLARESDNERAIRILMNHQ